MNNENRINLADAIPLRNPLTIHLELTNKCNFSCQYCPESLSDFDKRVGGFKSVTLDEFAIIAEQIRILGKVSVLRLWIMGEPLLNKNIYDIIKMARDPKSGICDRVEITTNASLLNQVNVDKLLDSGVDLIKISIYGFGERQYDITQSNISSDRIFDNVLRLVDKRNQVKSKTKVYIKMVDPRDANELLAFKEKYSPLADSVEIFSPHAWVDSYAVDVFENNNKTKSIVETRKGLKTKSVCGFPFYTMSIHANGDVSVCCIDWEKKTLLGNVYTESLIGMWNGPKLKEIRLAHLEGARSRLQGCSTCDYFFDNCPENLDEDSEKIIQRLG